MINFKKIINSDSLGWLILPFFLLIWEVIALYISKPKIFPYIEDIWNALIYFITDENENIFYDIVSSLQRVIIGYSLGSIIGLIIGSFTGRIKFFSNTIGRLIQLLRPITPVALVSLAVLWFGIGETSKYLLIAWGVFFVVWISVDIGVRSINQKYIWAAQSLGASRLRLIWEIYMKAPLPVILSGLRTGIAISFILVFVAELSGASSGLGYRLAIAYQTSRPDRVLVCLILLGILGATADGIFRWSVTKLLPWSSIKSNLQ